MNLTATQRAVARVSTWVEWIARGCAYASAAGIFAIAALLTVSSLKRYIFLTPIQETEELGGLLFLATTFLALAHGLAKDRHVRLELLWRYLPSRWQDTFSIIGYLLIIFALVVLIRETWSTSMGSYAAQNRSVMTDILLWPWRLIMPATLSVVLAVAALRCLELGLVIAAGGREPSGGDAGRQSADSTSRAPGP